MSRLNVICCVFAVFYGSASAIFTENLEGVLLRKIGSVKISNSQKTLSWSVDLDDMRSEIENLESQIKAVKNSICKTDLCMEKTKLLEENLQKNQIMLDSITDSFADKIPRSKREIPTELDNKSNFMRDDDSVEVGNVSSEDDSLSFHTSKKLTKLSEILNKLKDKLYETDEVEKVEIALKRFENKLEAISITKRSQRFAGNFEEVEKSLESDFKLIKIPAGLVLGMSLNKALKFQKIHSKISNNKIKFSMKIPFIENEVYSFYELIVNPVIMKSFVMMLKTNSNFIALDGDFNGKFFKDLSNCIKTDDELFICENEEKSSTTEKCLQKMTLIEKSRGCVEEIFIAKLPETAVIERSDGIVWKYSQNEVKFLSCTERNQAIDEDECEVLDVIDQNEFTLKFFYSEYLEIPEDISPPQLENNKIYNRDDFFFTAAQLSNIRKSRSFIQKIFSCSNFVLAIFIFAVTILVILAFMIRRKSTQKIPEENFTKMKMMSFTET